MFLGKGRKDEVGVGHRQKLALRLAPVRVPLPKMPPEPTATSDCITWYPLP